MPAIGNVWAPGTWKDTAWAANTWANASVASDPPSISNIAPSSGTTDGGTEVTITGTDFVDGATVTFDGTPATSVNFINSTRLDVVTPAHAAGAVTVVVENPDAQDDSTGFTYIEPPDSGGLGRIKKRRSRAVMHRIRRAA